jgi:hypothetical protein
MALPSLTTLRLCHRFGKGPSATITRLPPELLSMIEDFVYQDFMPHYSAWFQPFECFQKTCDLLDHAPDHVWDAAAEFTSPCEACEDSDDPLGLRCGNECTFKFWDEVRDILLDGDGLDEAREDCLKQREIWEEKIRQAPDGKFTRLDNVRGNFACNILSCH